MFQQKKYSNIPSGTVRFWADL